GELSWLRGRAVRQFTGAGASYLRSRGWWSRVFPLLLERKNPEAVAPCLNGTMVGSSLSSRSTLGTGALQPVHGHAPGRWWGHPTTSSFVAGRTGRGCAPCCGAYLSTSWNPWRKYLEKSRKRMRMGRVRMTLAA